MPTKRELLSDLFAKKAEHEDALREILNEVRNLQLEAEKEKALAYIGKYYKLHLLNKKCAQYCHITHLITDAEGQSSLQGKFFSIGTESFFYDATYLSNGSALSIVEEITEIEYKDALKKLIELTRAIVDQETK